MESGSASRVLREIRTLYALGTLGGLTDAQLLELFLTRGGEDAEDAFAALVKRHGPMVLGVCRRMLARSHDAEDAFQATFLILVRRAASIGRREQLANWLYGVAVRTAKEARRRAARRHARETRLMVVSKVEPAHVEDQEELLPLLDEELNRLPPRYRIALVVCELEGKSRREAAEQLGLPEGTLSNHLARGRKLLRERLVKRGVSLGVGAWAGLPRGAVDAAVPDRLLDSTIRAALGPVSGGVASGTVSATVAALAEGVLKMMVLTRLTLLVAALMVVGMASLTACVVWAAVPAASDEPPKAQAAAGARDQAVAASDARQDRVRGVVVDEAGNPVAGIEVKTFKDRQPRAVTDERGRFDFPAPSPLLNRVIVLAGTADRTRQGVYDRDFERLEVATPQPIRITLKPSQAVFVRVTDKAGVPVPGAAVETLASYATGRTDENGTVVLRLPADAPIARIIALKPGRGFDDFQHGESMLGDPARELPGRIHLVLDGARTVRIRAIDGAGEPLAGIGFVPQAVRKIGKSDGNVFTHLSEIAQAKTDERGVATFDWLPPTTDPVIFEPRSEGYDTAAGAYLEEDATGTMPSARLLRVGTIRGRVDRPDGKPAAGILVMTEDRGRGSIRPVQVRTAADGSYELTVPASAASYFVGVADDVWAAPSPVEVQVPEGRPVRRDSISRLVRRHPVIHGTLTIGPDRRPGEGRTVELGVLRQILRLERSVTTDATGRYQIRVGPGQYVQSVPYEHLSSEQVTGRDIFVEPFTVKDETELLRDLWIPKPDRGPISGRVVRAGEPGRGVAGAIVRGLALPPSWDRPLSPTPRAASTPSAGSRRWSCTPGAPTERSPV